MALSKQVHLYSVDTSAFYDEEEMCIHNKMLKLYSLRAKLKKQKDKEKKKWELEWKLKAVNRLLKKYKATLVDLLNPKADTSLIRVLRQESIRDKNVISIFDSSTIRALNLKINELTDNLLIVNVFFFQVFDNLMKNGFIYNGERYIFLCASAGQIRTKKAVFIKESAYQKIEGQITCGLTLKEINEKGGCNPNKYLAYFSLSNSATDVWENFDIDKSIVVDDFETNVMGTVDFIDDKTYQIERKQMPVPIPHMDGAGIMLDKGTRMVRLPWVKGLLIEFPFDKFIQEKCPNGKSVIKDIYGKSHDVLAEGIRYIFTKSQFKMWKYYDSWEDYKTRFKTNSCQACYCNLEEQYIPSAKLNYQFLQSLTDMKDREIDNLVKLTVEDIEKVGEDFQTTMRLLGVNDYNPDPIPMQRALKIYPELMQDVYNKQILKDVKKSLVKQAKSGRLKVNGGYRFLSPDLYAFCEWLFLGNENPQGLLDNGEVYCRGYRDGIELACLRSPHLYREWPIRNNVRNNEIDRWFGMTQCIYTSTHDLITKYVMADCDGDKLLVIKDHNITTVAKRNMQNIVPLYYEMKKAQPVQLTKDSIFQGMISAYSTGNIGPYSNNISKIWNSEKVNEQEINTIRWLCMENNFCIDMAKTLYMPTRPQEIDDIIKSYTKAKVPNFFIWAKDKTTSQTEPVNNSTMNQIAHKIPDTRVSYCKTLGKFNYKNLLNSKIKINIQDAETIVSLYDYWSKSRNYLFSIESDRTKNEDEYFVYQQIRENIIQQTNKPVEYIVNILVEYLYNQRKSSAKQVLWASFGKELVDNLENNLVNANPYCPICGKRFKPLADNQICCSRKCATIMDNQKRKIRHKNAEGVCLLETQ